MARKVKSVWAMPSDASCVELMEFEGTLCRFANFILSKEDPTEAFFKAIPTAVKGNQIEISYPV